MNNQETQIQEEKVDLKGLFFRYYNHWYYFVISLFVFSLIALAYIRYTTPIFSVSSTILIRDDKFNYIKNAEVEIFELEK